MSFKVYGTPVFERQRKRLTRKFPLLKIEIESLIADLKQGTLPGNIVPGTRGGFIK